MSSNPYARELRPDKRLRIAVLAGAATLQLAGIVLLTGLPVSMAVRLPLLALCLFLASRELRRQYYGYRRVATIRISIEGFIDCVDSDERRCRVELVGGSFVLPGFAWLRMRFPDRHCYGELLAGDSRSCESWHWLQLCWRQHGRGFGRAD